MEKKIRYKTKSRLQEVKSYNQATPYPVGGDEVKGIISVTGNVVRYMIDHITFETNTLTGETFYEISYDLNKEEEYEYQINLFNENEIFTSSVHELIPVERPGININKIFQRLADIKTLSELEEYGSNYFTIHS